MNRFAATLSLAMCIVATGGVGRATAASVVHVHDHVLNEYIVTMTGYNRIPDVANAVTKQHGSDVLFRYSILPALHVRLSAAAATALANNPNVVRVEENGLLRPASVQTGLQASTPGSPITQASRWGLDRIDRTSGNVPRFDDQYSYCTNGSGVNIYIIDTGVLPTHPEFGGRVDPGSDWLSYLQSTGEYMGTRCWQYIGSASYPYQQRANASHGTSVASVAAGATYGAAKSATIVDIWTGNCIDGTTPYSRLLKALQFIGSVDTRSGPKIVNISSSAYTLGLHIESTIDDAINSLTDGPQNIKFTVAAGNGNSDAWWYVPAQAGRAITVGGVQKGSDSMWEYDWLTGSNWGGTVAIYAPSQYVESASIEIMSVDYTLQSDLQRSQLTDCQTAMQPDGTIYVVPDTCTSGTSFAAPFVAGAIARYLQNNPNATRDQVLTALQAQSAAHSGADIVDVYGNHRPILTYVDCQ